MEVHKWKIKEAGADFSVDEISAFLIGNFGDGVMEGKCHAWLSLHGSFGTAS
jgi:hypothetical protein